MRIIPYVRWSSDKQAQGSSLVRQTDTILAYCAEKGWTLEPAAEWIRDEGVSAYKGSNMLPVAALGKFTDFVCREGGHDITLMVEQLDRLSRKEPGEVVEWFLRVTNAGLTVVLCDNKIIVSKASIRNQTDQLRQILDDSERAHSEVERRARLLRAAWDTMRTGKEVKAEQVGTVLRIEQVASMANPVDTGVDIHFETKRGSVDLWQLSGLAPGFDPQQGDTIARGTLLGTLQQKVHVSATCPGWLTLSRCRRFFEVKDAGLATLMSIFEWYGEGISKTAIARRLNDRGDKPWRGGNGWSPTSVKSVVESRSSLGEYQHASRARGITIGDPVPDYFPQVVSNELWQRANAPRLHPSREGRGRSILVRNLFADIATCWDCEQKMYFNRKTRKRGNEDECYLLCSSHHLKRRNGRGELCPSTGYWRYKPILNGLLDRIMAVMLDDQHFSNDGEVADLNARIADQRRTLEGIDQQLSNIVEALRGRTSARLNADLDRLEALEEAEKATLVALERELMIARGAVDPVEHVRRVGEIRADMDREDDLGLKARTVVKNALNDLVETMIFAHEHNRVVVVLRNGRRTIMLDRTGEVLTDVKTWQNQAGPGDDAVLTAYYRRLNTV